MKARIVIPLALMGLFSVGSAYAMTGIQAKELSLEAYAGNTVDLANLCTAAKSGDAEAQSWLGSYWSVRKDYTKSNYWYEKAADQGNVRAEYFLGLAYANGQGVTQNTMIAITWWKKAGAQGYADAEYLLGITYTAGQGVPQDYAKADYWYKKAAAQGNVRAEDQLGDAYYLGRGMPKNYAKSNYWFEKAAAQGYAEAEFNLGNAYYYGHGVPQDTMTAITWWKKAAAQGGRTGRNAQYNINLAERG